MSFNISIVATTRNDNHGGDLIKRTEAFVNGIYVQAKNYRVNVELIIVEWNPPAGRALLHEVLPPPPENTPVCLRYIVVPAEVHNRYVTASKIPLFQMTAKNVGIIRAKADFILCTNIDILFSGKCFEFLASGKLLPGFYYRTNRADIPGNVLSFNNLTEQLIYAEKNIIRKLGKAKGRETIYLPGFIRKHKKLSVFLNSLVFKIWKFTYPDKFPHFRLDSEACGDFTLMSKQDWMKIEGYAELDMYSIHIDTMALWAANAVGIKQEILPDDAPVYHIDHKDGWESDEPVRMIKFLEGKPCLDYSIVFKAGMEIVKNKRGWNLNPPDWGFANEQFKEYIFEPGKEMREVN